MNTTITHCQKCGKTSPVIGLPGFCGGCHRERLWDSAPETVKTDINLLHWINARDEVESLIPLDLREYLGMKFDDLWLLLEMATRKVLQ